MGGNTTLKSMSLATQAGKLLLPLSAALAPLPQVVEPDPHVPDAQPVNPLLAEVGLDVAYRPRPFVAFSTYRVGEGG